MLDEMPKWVESGDGEGDYDRDARKKEPSLSVIQGLQPSEGFMSTFKRRLRTAVNITLNVLLWAAIGAGCWFAHGIFTAPDFSEMKARFEADCYPEEGERMSELGKICRNGAETPMACKALYFGNIAPKASDVKGKSLE